MIDSMIFDALVDQPEAWEIVAAAVREHRLVLMTTPVQEGQIAAVPDVRRRRALQRVPREVVPSSASIPGYPAPGLGEGPIVDAVSRGVRDKDVADAVIAATARDRCDVLVTEDKGLAHHAAAGGSAVWGAGDLVEWARHPAPG